MNPNQKEQIEQLIAKAFGETKTRTKSAQILTNYDLYGPLSNPLTHLHDYPSIAAAQKERLKRRKKLLEMILSTRPDVYKPEGKKPKGEKGNP